MAGAFTAVDLSRLPFPDAVEALDFETILAAMLADYLERAPGHTALLESDPSYKVLEAAAYRELLLRQRVNEAVKAVVLAYAIESDLDQIAARYNVQRLVVVPADDAAVPPTPAVMESDESLRRRVQMSFEGFSTAGPRGAYIFHALGADGRVLDASAHSPTPGAVHVAVLSAVDDGEAPQDLLDAVGAALNDQDVRPLTDQVTVKSANIIPYSVTATLTLHPGPDSEVVMVAAHAALAAYAEARHRLGLSVTLSGIYSALHQEGVQDVALAQPVATVAAAWDQAPFCTGIALTASVPDA